MVKELLLAIILGGALGFIITGSALGLIKNKLATARSTSPTPTLSVNVTPTLGPETPTPTTSTTTLLITSPENESIVNTAKITIDGTTDPLNNIVVKTEKNNYIGTANSSGKFSIPVELDTGINLIQVDSFDKNDNQQEKEITVTFSTAKI